ncbi:methylated-DNA--[protein]-cysteine S-methyltransferase [Salicola sp. Rm-C-2C1-2]|uniref:methylated-DNA--[protein]-cysteine S-methyltransferase n=1 Tax=Salicola sp. Rm-C-2C1-2 TaxID=3141321 RepID=UPI0032E3B9BE
MNVVWLQRPDAVAELAYGELDSPWGRVWTLWHEDALAQLAFVDNAADVEQKVSRAAGQWGRRPLPLPETDKRLTDLAGILGVWPDEPPAPMPILEMVGSSFRKRVWRYLLRLNPGQCLTYGEIARHIGQPGAARAVGSAVGANPVPVLVPCHRVLPVSGGTGRYGGGEQRKRWLLSSEGVAV